MHCLASTNNELSNHLFSQHLPVLLYWHPIKDDIVSAERDDRTDDRNSVLTLRTWLKTGSQSVLDAGIQSNHMAMVYSKISVFVHTHR